MLQLRNIPTAVLLAAVFLLSNSVSVRAQEAIVVGGTEELISFLKSEDWWGGARDSAQLQVPHIMLTGISPQWRENAQKMQVPEKKEIFYRLMLPLVVHANSMIVERRKRLQAIKASLDAGETPTSDDLKALRQLSVFLDRTGEDTVDESLDSPAKLQAVIDDALYRFDVIPPGLALGQAAYESGYGTSRFAVEGNALFGQWTYNGQGLKPSQQRADIGDHRIASYEWPFDSVRGYFINLSTHPAYEEFRRLRAELKAAGKPLSSLQLADGLINYSERRQEYVDTLKGIIRVNHLDNADNAVFRDEPVRFLLAARGADQASILSEEIERMRVSGELESIVARMRLE